MARISFRCSEGFLAAVDRERGKVPRERWVRDVVEEALGLNGGLSAPMAAASEQGFVVASEFEMDRALSGLKAERLEVRKSRPKLEGCSEHPGAGRVESRGGWWCGMPGCAVRVG